MRTHLLLLLAFSACTLLTHAFTQNCGDGFISGNEECDDGNLTNNDGCSADCLFEPAICGDGILQAGEPCDDSNQNNNDGCSDNCQVESCGDGIQQASEECDDGNLVTGDGCDVLCQLEAPPVTCGDSVVDAGEVCDGANLNGKTCQTEGFVSGTLACLPNCLGVDIRGCTQCGDNILDPDEVCDGTNLNNQSCSSLGAGANGAPTCKTDCSGFIITACLVCGDGVLGPQEICYTGLPAINTPNPTSVAIANFNNDSKLDFVVSDPNNNQVKVFAAVPNNNTFLSFSFSTGAGSAPVDLVVTDFSDSSTGVDIVVADKAQDQLRPLNSGAAFVFTLGTAISTGVGSSPFSLVSADFNQDGNQDLAVANLNTQNIFICKGTNQGTCVGGFAIDLPNATLTPLALLAADINGDGKQDLLVTVSDSNNQTIDLVRFLNNGTAIPFSLAEVFSLSAATDAPAGLSAGDFDGDGINELAVAFPLAKLVKLLRGNDLTLLNDFQLNDPAANLTTAALDSDANADLIIVNTTTNNVSVIRNSSGVSSRQTFPTCVEPVDVAAGDMNGDGFDDFVVACKAGNQVQVFLSNP